MEKCGLCFRFTNEALSQYQEVFASINHLGQYDLDKKSSNMKLVPEKSKRDITFHKSRWHQTLAWIGTNYPGKANFYSNALTTRLEVLTKSGETRTEELLVIFKETDRNKIKADISFYYTGEKADESFNNV